MSLVFMLDTDTVSFALRGQGRVANVIMRHRPSELCVSVITVAELRYGATRRKSAKLHELIDTFTRTVAVVPFVDDGATEFGRIASKLADAGSPIGELDALIAAHAMSLELTLVTNHVKHFSRVLGLNVESWV